jgi:hypothetical protein
MSSELMVISFACTRIGAFPSFDVHIHDADPLIWHELRHRMDAIFTDHLVDTDPINPPA